MLKKLVLMMVALLLTVSVAPLTNACVSIRFNDAIILFSNGVRLCGNDRQYIKSVSAANETVLRCNTGWLLEVDGRIEIKEAFDTVVCGLSAKIPEESFETIKSLGFVDSISKPCQLEPAAAISAAELVNATPMYSIQDDKNQFITGKGIVVGVIDSGIDYRHPDLGAGKFGDNAKVIGGTNFVSKNDPPIDDDNIGHGTAIAGLIACDAKTKYPGVAPGSLLRSYKVFNNIKKTVSEDTVISALNQAAKDGCQVINISLSCAGTGAQSALAKATQDATNSGFVVVGAAGDFGAFHSATTAGTIGGSGVAQNSICVGASDVRQGYQFQIVGKFQTITGMSSIPYMDFGEQAAEIVDGGYGTLDELSSLTLRGKYVMMKRGPEIGESISYIEKVLNAKRRGASGAIIWNNVPGELVQMDITFNKETGELLTEKDLIPSCFINYSNGLLLKSLIGLSAVQIKPSATKLYGIAKFSSIGPTEGLVFKPDFCAPGIGLNAPMSLNPANPNVAKYSNTFAGTSASAALASGACALLKQYRPTWSPDDIRLALMNTSKIITNVNSGFPTSFQLQGAGTIDVASAANTPAFISPGGIIFNSKTKEVNLKIKGAASTNFIITTEVYDGFSDKIKLSVSATSKSISKDKEEQLTVTAEFEPESLPYNMQGMINFETSTIKLHVPVIFWKDFQGAGSRPIKTASFANKSFDYTKPDKKIDFEFAIGSGDRFETPSLSYIVGGKASQDETSKYNSLTSLSVDLVDGNGDTWVTIKRYENIQAGYYKFSWDGMDSEGINKIPNGTYGIKFVQYETELVKSSTNKKILANPLSLKGKITVSGSDIAQPPQIFMLARPVSPSENQKFIIDIYLTNIKDLSMVTGEITYPSDEVTILDVKTKGFLGSDGSSFDSDIFMQGSADEKGKAVGTVLFSQKRMSDKGVDGWGIIVTLIATCPKAGNPEITFRNQILFDSKGTLVPHMASPLVLDIVSDEPLTGDLNFDGIVDMLDVFIFSQSYGLTSNDKNFNMLADFNNDGIVDGKDYDILRKNLGKKN